MSLTRSELKDLMIDRCDVDEVIDILDPSLEEVVEALMDNDNILERNYASLEEFFEEGY